MKVRFLIKLLTSDLFPFTYQTPYLKVEFNPLKVGVESIPALTLSRVKLTEIHLPIDQIFIGCNFIGESSK